jgi:DNA-directed RNA polymerase subunit RPC12/RpoP
LKVVELRCPRCGAQVDQQSGQCKYCGARLVIVGEAKRRKRVQDMTDEEILEETERIVEDFKKEDLLTSDDLRELGSRIPRVREQEIPPKRQTKSLGLFKKVVLPINCDICGQPETNVQNPVYQCRFCGRYVPHERKHSDCYDYYHECCKSCGEFIRQECTMVVCNNCGQHYFRFRKKCPACDTPNADQ